MIEITSNQNPKIKAALALKERKEREKEKKFLIEGYRELRRALDKQVKIESLFISPSFFLGDNEPALIQDAQNQGAVIYTLAAHVMEKLSYRDRPDGLIAIAHTFCYSLSDLPIKKNSLFIVAESIEKPGNLGTILRSADAAGVDGVIVSDPLTDIFNPNVVRASVGTLFTQKIVQASSLETLQFLKENQIAILAGTPHAAHFFTDVDLTPSIAIIVGTEQLGLSDLWMKEASLQVKIPMMGVADSLNVASATTLLLYEALRQRRALHV